MTKRRTFYAVLSILVVGVVAFQIGAYSYFERIFLPVPTPTSTSGNHNNSNSSSTSFEVNVIINYGNNTSVWFNHTRVPESWDFYNVTVLITSGRVHSEYYPAFGEHQVLGLNGIEQNSTDYWSLWKFCPRSNAWAFTPVGVDLIPLSNHGVYGWYYQSQSGTHLPPVVGAKTIVVLDIGSC